eukprot:3967012-Pleurochrysis_carterae.AAC.1
MSGLQAKGCLHDRRFGDNGRGSAARPRRARAPHVGACVHALAYILVGVPFRAPTDAHARAPGRAGWRLRPRPP